MSIQWYPGHMAKTKRLLLEQLRWVDIVLELGDARLPQSSINPLLKNLLGKKPKLLLLNKKDLADDEQTDKWLAKLQKESPVLTISAVTGSGISKIVPLIDQIVSPQKSKMLDRGVRATPARVMVVGIPNIGKSSLINKLVGGAKVKTGKKAGLTRGNQWIRIHEKVELLDTPGLLWPKFEDPEVAKKLAAVGAVKDDVFDIEELSGWLLGWLNSNYPQTLERYGSDGNPITLEEIGRSRGCLLHGGRVDTLKAAQIFLREFRSGNLGKVTMDNV